MRDTGTTSSSTVSAPEWLPGWIGRLGAPVWVCDPDQRIVFANARAHELLDRPELVGGRCYERVAARDAEGRPLCRRACLLRRAAGGAGEVLPFVARTPSPPAEHWILVLPIPLQAPDGSGPWIVHCAHCLDQAARLRGYLELVASRSRAPGAREVREALARLSPREREVLAHLARDEDPATVARGLHVSPVTVRNHVQHVLAKLRVHSMEEAVAAHLLHAEEDPEAPAPDRPAPDPTGRW